MSAIKLYATAMSTGAVLALGAVYALARAIDAGLVQFM